MAVVGNASISESLMRTSRSSGYARNALIAVFSIFCILSVSLFGLKLLEPVAYSSVNIWIIPEALSLVVLGAFLLVLIAISDDIYKGKPPFSFIQAKRIRWIGWLLIIDAFLELIISMNAVSFVTIGGVEMGIVPSGGYNEYPSLYINVCFVVGAIICFCLSHAFKYGALLQQLSDDTV